MDRPGAQAWWERPQGPPGVEPGSQRARDGSVRDVPCIPKRDSGGKLKRKTTCTLNDAGLFDPVRFGILSHMPARALGWLTVTMKKGLGWGMFSRRQST